MSLLRTAVSHLIQYIPRDSTTALTKLAAHYNLEFYTHFYFIRTTFCRTFSLISPKIFKEKVVLIKYKWVYELEVLVAHNFDKSLQTIQEKTFTMEQVHRLLDKEPIPRLETLFQVALTIPVTSCSCEWSFCYFRCMKTWLGTRMMRKD